MNESTLWWIVAGFFVSLELLSGTFYLLMLALGAAAAAVTASAGASQPAQFVAAALVGGAAVGGWHWHLLRRGPLSAHGPADKPGNLDIGEQVNVASWATDGTTHVQYRGSDWKARHHGPQLPVSGLHRIKGIEGNQLILEKL